MTKETREVEHLEQSDNVFDRFIATLTQHDITQSAAGALTLQLVGGTEKTREGRHIRSQLHIGFIVGGHVNLPGLTTHLTQLTPNATKINASNSTYTGLIGSIRSLGPNDGWFLENGPLTNQETEYMAIQHPDGLDDKTSNCLKEIAGSGGVTISKKGYHETVPANASLLLIGSPVYSEWDEYESIERQIPIGPSLTSSLDIVYVDIDGREERIDASPIAVDVAREHIDQARTVSPRIPVHVDNTLFEALVDIHVEALDKPAVPQQARDTIRRLAEASAKIRLAEEVTTEDAHRAITVYRRPFEDIHNIDYEPSDISSDAISGRGADQQEHRKRRVITRIFANANGPLAESEILETAQEKGLSRRDALVMLGELKGKGELGLDVHGDWYAFSTFS